ncbi:MAG TPA: RIP metalloprotease RseP [Ruminococcaceae bacterium]|nr:RIP metalloprotease RseP [Oscillospiraceae bacterium]
MQILITIALIIIGVLLFEFIIFAHEFGHFITAKRSGVQVNEFALGMGPKIFGFKKGETQYSLRLFPVGGYCSMEGEDEESDNPRAFVNAKIWKRMIIIVAGAFMNFVVGLLFVFILTLFTPQFGTTTIDQFAPNAASACSGLQEGDKILSIDGYNIFNAKDLQFAIQTLNYKNVDPKSLEIYREDCAQKLTVTYSSLVNDNKLSDEKSTELYKNVLAPVSQKINASGTKDEAYSLMKSGIDQLYKVSAVSKPKDFKYPEIEVKDERIRYTGDVRVVRGGAETELKDVHFYTYYKDDNAKKEQKYSVMMDFYVTPKEKNFGTIMEETFTGTLTMARSVWKSLVMLVQGRFSFNELSGPVGITKAVETVAADGLENGGFGIAVFNILSIMALITVNLGIVNMLPFPALDGGRFVFLLIEAIFRKPIPRKVEYIVNGAGLAILLLFIAVVSVKDVFQLITGTFPTM